jgi:hypothetical protein
MPDEPSLPRTPCILTLPAFASSELLSRPFASSASRMTVWYSASNWAACRKDTHRGDAMELVWCSVVQG